MYHSNNGEKSQENYKKNAVIRLLQSGYNLIPVSGKFPPCIKWKPYQSKPVTPEDVVSWGENKFVSKNGKPFSVAILNFGLLTGIKSYSPSPAIVVIDSDDEAADTFVVSRCPETPVRQRTGKGGTHRVYRRPDNISYIPNRQKTHYQGQIYNLDIRADGGYILAPGSIHPVTGKVYTEVSPWDADLISSAPVYDPAWLPDETTGDRTTSTTRAAKPSLTDRQQQAEDFLSCRPGTTQGQGAKGADSYCFALAMDLIHGFSLTPEDALPVFLQWGEKESNRDDRGGYYPWTEPQLLHKLTDAALKISSEPPGYLLSVDDSLVDRVLADASRFAGGDPGDKPTQGYQFQPITSAQFATANYKIEWLVKNLLVKGQPGIIGGPKKSLKTNMLVALNIALASGTTFLNHFKVYRPVRCCLISGESGGFTLQETALRICKSIDLDLADLSCYWDFVLPKLTLAEELAILSRGLKDRGIEVVIIDPLYLCLLAGADGKNAANLFDMGPILLEVAKSCLSVGTTPLLVQHARKNLNNPYEALDLEDLAFAGIQEFARQWMLLSRRAAFEPGSGLHQLWLTAGGSVGHGGLWGLDVDEGQLNEDFTGRIWDASIIPYDEIKAANLANKEAKQNQKEEALDYQLVELVANWSKNDPPTKTCVLHTIGWGNKKFARVLTRCIDRGDIVFVEGYSIGGNGAKIKSQTLTTEHKQHKP